MDIQRRSFLRGDVTMQDMIIAGTGNSRYLKSSIDADITLSELVSMLRAGTFPFDFNGINPDGITQQGTPLNTATLLSDDTAEKIWGTVNGDPTVNLALAARTLLTGSSAPTTSTVGAMGQVYWDSSNEQLYTCVSSEDGVYEWKLITDGLQVGDLLITAREDVGNSYLLCNGEEVSYEEYPGLKGNTLPAATTSRVVYPGGSTVYEVRFKWVNGYWIKLGDDAYKNNYPKIAYSTEIDGEYTVVELTDTATPHTMDIIYFEGYWIVQTDLNIIYYSNTLDGPWTEYSAMYSPSSSRSVEWSVIGGYGLNQKPYVITYNVNYVYASEFTPVTNLTFTRLVLSDGSALIARCILNKDNKFLFLDGESAYLVSNPLDKSTYENVTTFNETEHLGLNNRYAFVLDGKYLIPYENNVLLSSTDAHNWEKININAPDGFVLGGILYSEEDDMFVILKKDASGGARMAISRNMEGPYTPITSGMNNYANNSRFTFLGNGYLTASNPSSAPSYGSLLSTMLPSLSFEGVFCYMRVKE